MAVSSIAKRLAQLAKDRGPEAIEAIKKATSGRVSNVTAIANYVKTPQQLSVVTKAVASVGVDVSQAMPDDLVGADEVLNQIRASAQGILVNAQQRFGAGSDTSLNQSAAGIAVDLMRRRRVEACLEVYGSKEKYFLCHPNGGVPMEDFIWYERVVLQRR